MLDPSHEKNVLLNPAYSAAETSWDDANVSVTCIVLTDTKRDVSPIVQKRTVYPTEAC